MGIGVYLIHNTINNKVYVGSSINMQGRWKGHKRDLHHGNHHNQHLKRSWDKHGEDAFELIICEYIKDSNNLIDREQYWLDYHRLLTEVYNCGPIVRSPMLGTHHTEEHCRAISVALTGRTLSEEHKRRIGEASSKALKGNVLSEETKQKISESEKGRVLSDETKRKISEAKMGHIVSDETRKKMSDFIKAAWARGDYDSRKNRPPATEGTKYKISKGVKASWARKRKG